MADDLGPEKVTKAQRDVREVNFKKFETWTGLLRDGIGLLKFLIVGGTIAFVAVQFRRMVVENPGKDSNVTLTIAIGLPWLLVTITGAGWRAEWQKRKRAEQRADLLAKSAPGFDQGGTVLSVSSSGIKKEPAP